MRKLILLFAIASLSLPMAAQAHQPVILTAQDTSASKGPLLVDGTISFAVRASFSKAGESKGFRAQFKIGDSLALQYLILDKSPENKLKSTQLPTLTVTAPSGAKQAMKLNERTKFFEPYSQSKYLYLARSTRIAEAGIYSFTLIAKTKSAVTIAVGDREVQGEVIRGDLPTPSPTPSPTLTTQTSVGITQLQVEANNSSTKCWSIINDNVYDLTKWIKSHPGGQSAITFICGKDGTDAFLAQHRGQSSPFSRLASFYIGPFIG